jgi:subtilisin
MPVSLRFRAYAFSAVGALLLAMTLVAAAPAATSTATSDEYIVVLKDDVAHPANVAHRHEENRGADIGYIYGAAIKGYSAELTSDELSAIKQDPNVDYVQRNGLVHATSQSPATSVLRVFANRNSIADIDEKDDARVNADIAVLDTGVMHPDINVVSRVRCSGGACVNDTTAPINGHGTFVAGLAGAIDNNSNVVGTAPGARIWSVKVLNGIEAEGTQADIVAGINWVTAHSDQIEVANMSLGGEEYSQAEHDAIAASVDKGVVYVAAAGNASRDVAKETPAAFPDVITVSAVSDFDGAPGGKGSVLCTGTTYGLGWGSDDHLAPYSNFGPGVDIAAPGTCILSTWLNGELRIEYGGTSFAAPLVSGAAALLASRSNPNSRADVEGIRNTLRLYGNYDWWDDSNDGVFEPMLDMHALGSSSFDTRTPPFNEGPPTDPPPTVTMGSVSNVTESSATINGTVNPNGRAGRYKFACGAAGYGQTMISAPEGTYFDPDSSPINVSWTVSGLYPGASYYCQLVAWNVGTEVYSSAANFTTPLAAGYVAAGAPAPLRVSDGSIHVFTRSLGVGDELNFTRTLSGMWTAANLTPAGQPKMGASSAILQMKNGAMHAFAINAAGDIVCYYRTGSEPWNYINLSAYAGATLKFDKTTTPSAVEWGPNRVGVYARAVNGDLVSLERNADGTWFMWNESEKTAGHPTIVGSPAAVVTDGSSAYANAGTIVFARNSSNQLVSFNCNAKGEWLPYNVSTNTGMAIKASPSALVVDPKVNAGSVLSVYAPNTGDDLVEFNRAASGAWSTYDVTKNISGEPDILGSVAPIKLAPSVYAGSVLGVYARTIDNDLVGFDRKANGAWYFYNVSANNSYPKISSSPAVLALNPANYFDSVLQVHARSTGNDLVSFDRKTNGGWLFYNETVNVPGNLKVE